MNTTREQWEINWKDYYRILGLSRTATAEQIKSAYKRLIVQYNPGKFTNEEEKRAAQEQYGLVNEAFTVLGYETKKAKYDAVYEERTLRQPAGSTPRPAGTPTRPAGTPTRPAGTPARPAGTPARPAGTPARPAGTPTRPAGTPTRPAGTPARPAGTTPTPAGTPTRPAGTPPRPEDRVVGVKAFCKKHKKKIIIGIVALLLANKLYDAITDHFEDDKPQPTRPSVDGIINNPTEAPLEVEGQEIVINNPTKNPTVTPTIDSTPSTSTPVVESTPTAEPTPVETTPSVDDALQKEIDAAAENVYTNWQNFNSEYSKETIVELIKVLNNQPSTMSIETADEILKNIVERAVTPGINNAFAGQTIYETHQIDFSSLLVGNKSGYSLVRSMELDLNGALVDPDNLIIYGERAFTDEALMLGEYQAIDGVGAYSGNPAARLLWSRLAIGTNGIVGSLGDDLTVTINDTVYSQDDLNNATVLEDIARNAKVELGNTSKTMSK